MNSNWFINYAIQDPVYYFSWVLIAMFSICVHEYCHAAVAHRLGDDTAAMLGHLTLNPAVQMGPTSIIMLLFLGIAWGAVPVNVNRLRGRGQQALVSFAGPCANLILCMVLSGLVALVEALAVVLGPLSVVANFFYFGAIANGVLFLFNMLPIPMFDGWSVFALFIPSMRRILPHQAATVSWVMLALVFFSRARYVIWFLGQHIADGLVRLFLIPYGLGS